MVGGKKPEDISYSSKDIIESSTAGRSKNFFVRIKKQNKSAKNIKALLARINSRKNRKVIIVTAITTAVLLVGAVVALIVILNWGKTNNIDTPVNEEDPNAATLDVDAEDPKYSEETIAEKTASYDEKIEKAGSNDEKAKIYAEKAMYLWDIMEIYEGRDYSEQVLNDLKKADELSPSARSAYNICLFLTSPEEEESTNQEVDYCQVAKDRDPNFFTEEDENEWV